jgi:hypothetical protein
VYSLRREESALAIDDGYISTIEKLEMMSPARDI